MEAPKCVLRARFLLGAASRGHRRAHVPSATRHRRRGSRLDDRRAPRETVWSFPASRTILLASGSSGSLKCAAKAAFQCPSFDNRVSLRHANSSSHVAIRRPCHVGPSRTNAHSGFRVTSRSAAQTAWKVGTQTDRARWTRSADQGTSPEGGAAAESDGSRSCLSRAGVPGRRRASSRGSKTPCVRYAAIRPGPSRRSWLECFG